METGTIKTLAETSGQISGTMIAFLIFAAVWSFERIYKLTQQKKNGKPNYKYVNDQLEKKVNGKDCLDFKLRIGKESDEHRRNIADIKDGISTIKADIGYMKGKMG